MFGKVMSTIKPRMAVGYHVFNDFDTQPQIIKEVRQTYDGPFELAVDYMVFNVTKDSTTRCLEQTSSRRSEGRTQLLASVAIPFAAIRRSSPVTKVRSKTVAVAARNLSAGSR